MVFTSSISRHRVSLNDNFFYTDFEAELFFVFDFEVDFFSFMLYCDFFWCIIFIFINNAIYFLILNVKADGILLNKINCKCELEIRIRFYSYYGEDF